MPNQTYTQMENKQSKTIVVNETFENEYQRFIVDATNEVGDFVVENAVDELSTQGVDTSILADGEKPSIAEVSYTNKRKENYIYKIREDELKSATQSQEAYDELMQKINANLDEQDRKNCWRNFPKIISKTSHLKESQLVYNVDATDYAGILLLIRDAIRKVKTPTDTYNSYTKQVESNTYTLKTFSNRPVVFIKSSLMDELEIKFQSGVFNLDKIKTDADIVRVNEFYTDVGVIDENKLFLVCGMNYVKLYKTFEKRANLEDVRSFNVGKAVTYLEYCSKLVPAIWYNKGAKPSSK